MRRFVFGLLLAASPCAYPAEDTSRAQTEVSITLQSDGRHCAVKDVKLLCTDLVAHLRDVLRLPAGTRVRFRAGRSASYQAVKRVMDMLDRSEYPLPGAASTAPDAPGGK